ncbi:MAG: hypothetical protein ABIV63_06120 [Caldimonas sp.]
MTSGTSFRRRSMVLGGMAATLPWRLAAAAGGPAAADSPAPRQMPPRSAHVGINLAGINYWTTEFPFADLMKNSGGLSLHDPKTAPLALRPDGYPVSLQPGQTVEAAVAWDSTRYSTGKFVVVWEGDGELAFPLTTAKVASRAPGRIVLDATDNSGQMRVSIQRTNPADPVRNLRVLWPGTEATHANDAFNPVFLDRIAPFGTLRFMDWGATNGSNVVRWADRAKPTDVTFATERGVALEVMIGLANRLQANPWFCVPHQADDDYVRQFATLVRDRLDPRLVASIEYSNEVWNSGFAQARYAIEQAKRAGLPTPFGMGSIWHAERTRRILAIVDEVFGSAGRKRWLGILAAQSAWTQFGTDALGWKDTASHVDVLAIAPYFKAASAADPAKMDATLALSPDAILEQMRASIRGEVRSQVSENAKLASRYKLRLQGYEGGSHDTTFHFPADKQDAMTERMASAHTSPRMREVYRDYWETWIAAGGDLLIQYSDIGKSSKWGFWSVLETVTQDPATAPKYQGMLDVIAAHPLAAAR